MITKYEIKTYPDNPQKISKNKNSNHNQKDIEQITETIFHPKCIFTKQNDNISFYQSISKNSFKNSKNKDKNKTMNINPVMKAKNNKLYTIKNTNEKYGENTFQNYTYNYSDMVVDNPKKRKNRTIKNNINNININITPNTNTFNFSNDNNNNNSEYISKRNIKKRIIKSP